ncbi:MAG TPA: hypothetical protein EYP20_03365 [Aigarchaeota archaeon]|nr:hypothetical protein [Aigarchaeota archaeon]
MTKKVVILGGGPGGIATARLLSGRGLDVVMVTQGYTTIFKPVLTYIATGYRSPSDAIVQIYFYR